jgi:trimeric autotransporter adhesin
MRVSWQVTGVRKDPWANAKGVQVEEDTPDKERGYYIYVDLYGQQQVE